MYERRLRGEPEPWTDDPVLASFRFTNTFRAADRVSQYLIRNVIYRGPGEPDEVLFRILLFKFFNKVETWELLERELGPVELGAFSPDRAEAGAHRPATDGTRRSTRTRTSCRPYRGRRIRSTLATFDWCPTRSTAGLPIGCARPWS